MKQHWMTHFKLKNSGVQLRRYFDSVLRDPREANPERFQWDYWHVPDQYTLLRTPAYNFFPRNIYEKFHRDLVIWGREILGCHDISPPWLSCYVDGCRQRLHADQPHGPWAFVFSLTNWQKRSFRGGETVLLNSDKLSDWYRTQAGGVEYSNLTTRIAPRFGQLTVFDPRIPHGVEEVKGTQDPRSGRLVIHGWFIQPRPFWQGPLTLRQIASPLESGIGEIARLCQDVDINGYLSLRAQVGKSGAVTSYSILTNTLVGSKTDLRQAQQILKSSVSKWKFASSRGATRLTVPLRFGI